MVKLPSANCQGRANFAQIVQALIAVVVVRVPSNQQSPSASGNRSIAYGVCGRGHCRRAGLGKWHRVPGGGGILELCRRAALGHTDCSQHCRPQAKGRWLQQGVAF